eukprot:5032502-Pyramimonas_sp.AAC.2
MLPLNPQRPRGKPASFQVHEEAGSEEVRCARGTACCQSSGMVTALIPSVGSRQPAALCLMKQRSADALF